jgi:Fe-S-cluster-containing dehydrogenase component/formate-dependent nitrite reductase membrane component NrfD
MQYGFVIDHRRCIGCHACTVACKQENDVPVGNFRTWVKYVEKGRFPEIRRHFAVLRCNHCTNAPCVTICPVNALEKRKDGIVDLDRDVCIGCRACMQACPYDAIYLNEERGSVEKCHFCAHRVEKGLEPACVIVCPEQAIITGDLHDPASKVSQMVAEHKTLQRRVEQKTGPNVHYVGAEPIALHPGAAERPPTYLWSERPKQKPEPWPSSLPVIRDTRVTLDAGHKVEWGFGVAAYLVTKGIAAGAALLAPFAAKLGLAGFAADWLPEIVALAFVTLTTFLLVEDLARPKLFLTLLTRGNRKSWLVKGAYVLIAFSMTVSATLAARFFGWTQLVEALRWVNAALALGVAGYTAFLFAQCEGRDLWQSKILLPHLLVQAVVLGAAALLPFTSSDSEHLAARQLLAMVMVGGLVGHFLFALIERWSRHPTDNGKQAAAFLDSIRWGRLPIFRLSLFLIWPVPMISMAPNLGAVATAFVLLSILGYECAYVRAAQLPPLS